MKFVISSTELLNHLNAISKVISSKSTMPILDNFLFKITGNQLIVVASDLETTLITNIELENVSGEGLVAVPAKLIIETLREFSEQPLTFQIDTQTFGIKMFSENGNYNIVGSDGEEFPETPIVDEEKSIILHVGSRSLLKGIEKTLFATADDELRPVMNGIYIEMSPEFMSFVASDAHKLVRYRRLDVKTETQASFILPKKPAALLRGLLAKEDNTIIVQFNDKNAFFTMNNFKLVCRLVEGNYPSYNSVIPTNNTNTMTIDRLAFYNTVKRVSIFSNQASNLVRLGIIASQLKVSAQDIDFSISAEERLNCEHEGDDIEIGFKSVFLQEILINIPSAMVRLEMSDPSRAGLLLPDEKDDENEDVLMLLMPMMINVQ